MGIPRGGGGMGGHGSPPPSFGTQWAPPPPFWDSMAAPPLWDSMDPPPPPTYSITAYLRWQMQQRAAIVRTSCSAMSRSNVDQPAKLMVIKCYCIFILRTTKHCRAGKGEGGSQRANYSMHFEKIGATYRSC